MKDKKTNTYRDRSNNKIPKDCYQYYLIHKGITDIALYYLTYMGLNHFARIISNSRLMSLLMFLVRSNQSQVSFINHTIPKLYKSKGYDQHRYLILAEVN